MNNTSEFFENTKTICPSGSYVEIATGKRRLFDGTLETYYEAYCQLEGMESLYSGECATPEVAIEVIKRKLEPQKPMPEMEVQESMEML